MKKASLSIYTRVMNGSLWIMNYNWLFRLLSLTEGRRVLSRSWLKTLRDVTGPDLSLTTSSWRTAESTSASPQPGPPPWSPSPCTSRGRPRSRLSWVKVGRQFVLFLPPEQYFRWEFVTPETDKGRVLWVQTCRSWIIYQLDKRTPAWDYNYSW